MLTKGRLCVELESPSASFNLGMMPVWSEIYVQPFPGVEKGRWQISTCGGTRPVWARKSGELFYLTPEGTMMAVLVRTQPSFSASAPVTLFQATAYRAGVNSRGFDVTPDGKRFLMVKPVGRAEVRLTMVRNWFEELKRRVPLGPPKTH